MNKVETALTNTPDGSIPRDPKVAAQCNDLVKWFERASPEARHIFLQTVGLKETLPPLVKDLFAAWVDYCNAPTDTAEEADAEERRDFLREALGKRKCDLAIVMANGFARFLSN